MSLCSGGARWVAEKKLLRKGKISCSKLRGYLGGSGTVAGQCCTAVSCWRPKCPRSAAMFVVTPPSGMALGEQNILISFCLIVKRVNCTGLDVDICCEPEHQDFIISIYLACGGMPKTAPMLLISALEKVQTFQSGRAYLSH